MHRHRDLVAEGLVVEDVDAEKEDDVQKPAGDGHGVRFEVKRWVVRGELVRPCDKEGEDELGEGDEEA